MFLMPGLEFAPICYLYVQEATIRICNNTERRRRQNLRMASCFRQPNFKWIGRGCLPRKTLSLISMMTWGKHIGTHIHSSGY